MSDAAAKYTPGEELTFLAGGAITGGQLVEVTTAVTSPPTVTVTAGVSSKVMGVATHDAATGGLVNVEAIGVWELATTANVAAGDHVTSSTTGGVAPIGAGTFVQDIGIALAAATSPAVAPIRLNLT